VQALKKEGKSWCRYGQSTEDARVIFNSLQFWSVNYVRRGRMKLLIARLAMKVLFLMDEQIHMEKGPHFILDIVTVERSILDCSH
jgi:hypothetical protein